MKNFRMREHIKKLMWIFASFWILGVYLVLTKPLIKGPIALEKTYPLFSLSLISFTLLLLTSLVLFSRYMKNRKNKFTLKWGVSFAVYSLLFLILMLKSVGVQWLDTSNPIIFFIARLCMIFFIIGILLGFTEIVIKNKKNVISLVSFILALCLFIFYYGLVVVGDIELTMYAFLFFVFIPSLIYVAYLFYSLAKTDHVFSMKLLSIGFLLIAVAYMAWAPWHKSFFYFVWFALFNLGLTSVLAGFLCLGFEKEIMKKAKH